MRYFPTQKGSGALARAAISAFAIASAFVIGSSSGSFFIPVASANNGLTVTASPSSGTLVPGQALTIGIGDPTNTSDAVADSCLVNGVDVTKTWKNLSPGHYTFTYVVGAHDQSRAAGQIPIDCTMHQEHTVTVTAFDDHNTVAIDTTGQSSGSGSGSSASTSTATSTQPGGSTDQGSGSGSGGGTVTTPTAPALSMVSISPSSGTLTAGQSAAVTFTEASGQTDLLLAGPCLVNAKDVSNSFANLGNGRYEVLYTVASGDGERPAGHIPISCSLGNSAGVATAHAWLDGNSLSIDTNGDGTIDNGTSTLGFTTRATPSSGSLRPGDKLLVSFQDPLPSGDVAIGPMGCRVNDVNVASSYAYQGNGLYTVDYTVGPNDQSRMAGRVPVDCELQNATGSVHLTSFTDGDSASIDTSADATSSDPSSGSPAPLRFSVEAVPTTGVRTAGQPVEMHLYETNRDGNVALDGACTMNGVDVSKTWRNATDGQYILTYTVGANDPERSAGQIPVMCQVKDSVTGATTTIAAFTDGNTVAIDSNGDGTIESQGSGAGGSGSSSTGSGTGTGTSTGSGTGTGAGTGAGVAFLSSVSAQPSTGTIMSGDSLQVSLQEGTHDPSFTPVACDVNGVDVSNSFVNAGGGLYRFTYTVGSNDTPRSAGQIPVSCTLRNPQGETISSFFGFTDGNTVAVDPSLSSNPGTTGGTGSTSGSGSTGGTSGSETGSNGDTATSTGGDISGGTVSGGVDVPTAYLRVDSIQQVRGDAVAGGGYDNGWAWIFHITVPSNETTLRMKFDDWTNANGTSKLGAAYDMRISSPQAPAQSPVTITQAGTYSDPLTLAGDTDPNMPGRQVDIKVEVQVPLGSANGGYSTSYGIESE